ncbi:hypothetical protein HYU94_03940 [Candidatus Daviesbacteria bacterium]|nr:hypothetical protein [Candidatus Daviesbacteria bacterium]
MKERFLTRGCVASDIYEVISKRLNLPGSRQQFLSSDLIQAPQGLFFSQGNSIRGIIKTSEQYAIAEAEREGKKPFVITMRINEENFGCIAGRVWIPRQVCGSLLLVNSRIEFEYDSVQKFEGLKGSTVIIALDRMSDDELVEVSARVGLLLPEGNKFQYNSYKEYRKKPEFSNPGSMDEFNEWLKGFK